MEKLKRYFKYIIVLITVIILIVSYFLYINIDNEDTIKKEEITELKKEKKEDKKEEKEYIYVDVKGNVNNPDVYQIENDKRVIDAINIAGGLKDNSDTSILNLSKKLTDEMCIIIYTYNETEEYRKQMMKTEEINKKLNEKILDVDSFNDAQIKSTTKQKTNITTQNSEEKEETSKIVSINTANIDELLTISGIGESKAKAIISYREENGEFKQIEDIMNVSGIGESLFEKIKDYITV